MTSDLSVMTSDLIKMHSSNVNGVMSLAEQPVHITNHSRAHSVPKELSVDQKHFDSDDDSGRPECQDNSSERILHRAIEQMLVNKAYRQNLQSFLTLLRDQTKNFSTGTNPQRLCNETETSIKNTPKILCLDEKR